MPSPTRMVAALVLLALGGCSPPPDAAEAGEEETLARTEFTDRILNFFEYTPLHANEPSAFLIHLTDLDDGAPVANAQVDLLVHPAPPGEARPVTAQVGRVTGIYVAELVIPAPGVYAIEFHVRNEHLDERMRLEGFEVEAAP